MTSTAHFTNGTTHVYNILEAASPVYLSSDLKTIRVKRKFKS